MSKTNKHIIIVRSSTPGLSSINQESSDAIFTVLSKNYSQVDAMSINNLPDLEAMVATKPDLVFLGVKFIPVNPLLGFHDKDKIWLASYLDKHGIASTGSPSMAHELELDKSLAKQRVLDAGLNTSEFYVQRQGSAPSPGIGTLNFPVFIKPANLRGGVGVDSASVAHNLAQLHSKISSIATDFRSDSLVENYLSGREFSVAILQDEHSMDLVAMPIELVAPKRQGLRLLSEQVKSANAEQALKVTDKEAWSKVTSLAVDVFLALGARDYGRIDIRMDSRGTPHFLEANLIPSIISGYGSFPKACMINLNLGYEAMILQITRLGLARNLGVLDTELMVDEPVLPVATPAFGPV